MTFLNPVMMDHVEENSQMREHVTRCCRWVIFGLLFRDARKYMQGCDNC